MTETRPYVDWDLMNNFMIDVFEKCGVPREDAKICADVLLESDRRGIESHGCNRFKPIYLDRIKNGTLLPKTEVEVVKETPTTVVIDAHDGMGMVASHKMTFLFHFHKIQHCLSHPQTSRDWESIQLATIQVTEGPELLAR